MKRKQITLRLPEELYQKVQQEAERKGVSVNNLVVNALWLKIKNLA